MGFFSSLRELNKQANEINRNSDPGARMRESLSQMRQMREQMSAQQSATSDLTTTGTPGVATIIAVAPTGAWVNNAPMVLLHLQVELSGRPPYPTSYTGLAPLVAFGQLAPGHRVSVRVDTGDPQRVAVLWDQPLA